MGEVRRALIFRPVSCSSMLRQQREWWWLAPSVRSFGCWSPSKRRKTSTQYRFCREWIVIAEGLAPKSRLQFQTGQAAPMRAYCAPARRLDGSLSPFRFPATLYG